MSSASVQAFAAINSTCKAVLTSVAREDTDATTSRSVSTALETLRLAGDAHRFLGSSLCTSAHRKQLAVASQSLVNQVLDVCASSTRGVPHADPTVAALGALSPARLSEIAPLVVGMLNAAALLSSRLCRQLLAPSAAPAAAPTSRKRGGASGGGLTIIDGGGDDAPTHSSSGGSGSGTYGGADAAQGRELSSAACRIIMSQLQALAAALRQGHGSVPLLQPALLLSLAAFTALAPSQPLAFRPFALDAAAAVLELLEAQSDHAARAGQPETLCATAGDAAALHAALSDALATVVRLCAYARWPISTLTAGLTGSGAGSGAAAASGSSGAAGSGSGGAAPFALHLSPFVHRLLSLLDGDAALLMSVVSGAPYAAPTPAAVAHLLAAPAPDYASLAASAKTSLAPGSGSAGGADSAPVAAAAAAVARPDALVAPALFSRLLACLGALTSLLSPPVGGISALTEDGVACLGLAAPAALPVGALLASLSGLSALPSLRRVGLSQAQSEAVLTRALRLQATVYAAGGPALRRFRTHALGVHAALLRQPLSGGHANPIAAQRLRLLPAWIRAVGPGLPSPDFEAVLRSHALEASACLLAFCCGGTAAAEGTASTGSGGGSAVSADTACAAASCLHAVIASCWHHLPDGLRLTVERTLLACLDAAAGAGAAAARSAAPAAAAAVSAAAAGAAHGAGSGGSGSHMLADGFGFASSGHGDHVAEGDEGDGEAANEAGEEEEEEEEGGKVPGKLSKRGRYFKGAAGKFLTRMGSQLSSADAAGADAAAAIASSAAGGAPVDAAPVAKRLRRGIGAGGFDGPEGSGDADAVASASGNAPLAVLEALGGPVQLGLGASVAACLHGTSDSSAAGGAGSHSLNHAGTALLAVRAGRATVSAGASAPAAGIVLVLLPPAVLAALAGAAAACASAPWRAGAPSPLQQLLRQHTGACSGGGAGGSRALGLHSLALALPAHAPAVAAGVALSLPGLRALAASTAVPAASALLAAAAAQAEQVPALAAAAHGSALHAVAASSSGASASYSSTAAAAAAHGSAGPVPQPQPELAPAVAATAGDDAPPEVAATGPLAANAAAVPAAAAASATAAAAASAPPPVAAPAVAAQAAAPAAAPVAVDEDDDFPDIVD